MMLKNYVKSGQPCATATIATAWAVNYSHCTKLENRLTICENRRISTFKTIGNLFNKKWYYQLMNYQNRRNINKQLYLGDTGTDLTFIDIRRDAGLPGIFR